VHRAHHLQHFLCLSRGTREPWLLGREVLRAPTGLCLSVWVSSALPSGVEGILRRLPWGGAPASPGTSRLPGRAPGFRGAMVAMETSHLAPILAVRLVVSAGNMGGQ
jgi:hypothetical protein